MSAPDDLPVCPACKGDMSIGHDTPCARCRLLWNADELDSRGQCIVCDGQLARRLGLDALEVVRDKHPREAAEDATG